MEITIIICSTVLLVSGGIMIMIWRENVDADLMRRAKNRKEVEDFQEAVRETKRLLSLNKG